MKRIFVDFAAGLSIGGAICTLMNKKHEAMAEYDLPADQVETYGSFNEQEITSEMTEDECYIKITGKTRFEQEEQLKKFREEYERKEREWKEQIPALYDVYKERLKNYIKPEKYDYFINNVLMHRLNDIYHAYDVDCYIEIVKLLMESKKSMIDTMSDARTLFEDQGHSGWTAGLVAHMVYDFSPKYGAEFYEKVYKY